MQEWSTALRVTLTHQWVTPKGQDLIPLDRADLAHTHTTQDQAHTPLDHLQGPTLLDRTQALTAMECTHACPCVAKCGSEKQTAWRTTHNALGFLTKTVLFALSRRKLNLESNL